MTGTTDADRRRAAGPEGPAAGTAPPTVAPAAQPRGDLRRPAHDDPAGAVELSATRSGSRSRGATVGP